jgi:ribosomal protein S12 methylthiotransferase
MIQSGIKELIFVAQDTTYYGKDLNPKVSFGSMLEEIADISHKVWIRFLYGHPESIDDNTIKAIARNSNICSYFDIPIQHASDNVLKKMGRNYTNEDLLSLFENIRMLDPDACLRTTLITGFPGETDRDFQKLLTFVKNVEFNHLGVFTYSDSEDIPAHNLSCHVSAEVAQERLDHIISCQADISLAKNRSYIGKTLKVLVEKEPENRYLSGRTSFQAPDVDGITYIGGKAPQIGTFADVMITDASDYDLIGETV